MKKNIIGFAAIIALSFGLGLTSCSNAEKPAEEATTESTEAGTESATEATAEGEHAHAHYQCPMDCEKGKTYEEAGKCPVCKMDLAEVKS